MSHIPDNGKPSLMEMMKAAAEAHQSMRPRQPAAEGPPDAIPSLRKKAATLPMSNNAGGSAPPLVLLKRIGTPKEDQPMGNKFSTLLKSAVGNLERGNLETAERLLAEAERMQKVSVVHNHYYGDDETVDDTWSEAADGNAEGNNASLNDEPDDDDDEFDKRIRKASYHHPILGGAETLPEPKGTPVSTGHQADPYQLSVTPATRAASPHKFDRLVEHVQERDSCSKNEAMATARREYPDAYESFQEFVASSPTNEQATRRAGRGIGKSMPDTFEDLVASEMRKGVSWRTAEQRVINTYGSTALNRRMIKSDRSVAAEFSKRATAIMWEDGVNRTEALRRLRKEQPWLYDPLNAS
jgi:hypothetical protein